MSDDTDETYEAAERTQSGVFIAILGFAAAWIWRWYRQYRMRSALRAAVTAAGSDHLVDMLVPDGMGGGFHVDFLLFPINQSGAKNLIGTPRELVALVGSQPIALNALSTAQAAGKRLPALSGTRT